jgi:hypothetical protein
LKRKEGEGRKWGTRTYRKGRKEDRIGRKEKKNKHEKRSWFKSV